MLWFVALCVLITIVGIEGERWEQRRSKESHERMNKELDKHFN